MPLFIWAVIKWLGALVTSIAAFLTTYLGKRIALVTAAITVLLGLTTAMWAALEAIVMGIAVSAPSELTIALGWFVPGNIPQAFAAMMSAKILRFAYDFKAKGVQLRLL